MPRVLTRTKGSHGKQYTCSSCGAIINPGEKYFRWSFRYGGTRVACQQHYPRPSQLTQSRMGEVYSAVEDAQDGMDATTTVEEINELVEAVAQAAEEVAQEYRDAAEHFGGAGENAERADELEGWVSDLQGFEPEVEPDDETREAAVRAIVGEQMDADALNYDDLDAVISVFCIDEGILQEKVDELAAEFGALDTVRSEALDLIGGCPL